jgi:cytochrome c oxidase cbb3-type subunit 3
MKKKETHASEGIIEGEVHRVDDIVELNHPVPIWWQTILYISIVWAFGYMGYYLLGDGPTLRQELAADLQKLEMAKVVKTVSAEEEAKEVRVAFSQPERIVEGRAAFSKNCASCHAEDGGGGIGPNLADRNWIHGDGSIDAILKVIREGVAEKGMPPWGPILKREETISVAAFVRKLRDTTPAKPKSPQGAAVKPKTDL